MMIAPQKLHVAQEKASTMLSRTAFLVTSSQLRASA
jgi:hypothetical protein